jgi:hypothetical protein
MNQSNGSPNRSNLLSRTQITPTPLPQTTIPHSHFLEWVGNFGDFRNGFGDFMESLGFLPISSPLQSHSIVGHCSFLEYSRFHFDLWSRYQLPNSSIIIVILTLYSLLIYISFIHISMQTNPHQSRVINQNISTRPPNERDKLLLPWTWL